MKEYKDFSLKGLALKDIRKKALEGKSLEEVLHIRGGVIESIKELEEEVVILEESISKHEGRVTARQIQDRSKDDEK